MITLKWVSKISLLENEIHVYAFRLFFAYLSMNLNGILSEFL